MTTKLKACDKEVYKDPCGSGYILNIWTIDGWIYYGNFGSYDDAWNFV